MALPLVKSVVDCADYSKTFEPFLTQLRPLPQLITESITNPIALKAIYLDTNPLVTALAFSLALSPIALVVSEINKNYSQIDRLWSILPGFYHLHYALWAYLSGLNLGRPYLAALGAAIWSTRLTFNYWRRGGYQVGSEDYRWAIIKDYIGPTVMFLFNITFISVIQSVLLWAITTPTYILLLTAKFASDRGHPSADLGDFVAFLSILSLIVITATADEQQWNFQNARNSYRKTAKVPAGYSVDELERGFCTRGLFAYARKPNYAAEQSVWGVLYFWSCYAGGTWYNWSGIGFAGYLCLFQGSTWLTELLSQRKYPEYKEYRKQVGRFLPKSIKPPSFGKSSTKIANGPMAEEKAKDAAQARQRYDLR